MYPLTTWLEYSGSSLRETVFKDLFFPQYEYGMLTKVNTDGRKKP